MIQHSLIKLIACLNAVVIVLAPSVSFSKENSQSWEDRYQSDPYIRVLKEVEIKINKDYSYMGTVHIIDKIQNEGGKQQGEIAIGYDQSREEITNIEARTILPDGTKLPYEKIKDVNAPGNFGVYSDNRVKMISMPGVVVGSIVDLKYTKKAKPVIENQFYDAFSFSCNCPIKEARYRITAPKDMKLNLHNLNLEIKPRIEKAGDEITYTWETLNNEKDELEEFMPPADEVVRMVSVSTLCNWEELSDWAWSINRKNLKITPEMKKRTRELTFDMKETDDKVKAILGYIQAEYRYVALNIDSHSYEPHPSDETFLNKYGDCKDLTLLAVAMLSEIGVKAWPALISTNSELKQPDLLPMPLYYDHVIVNIDLNGKRYFTDILLKGYRFQQIPSLLSAKRVFVVNDRGGYFDEIPLADRIENTNISHDKVLILGDGTAVNEMTAVFSRNFSIGLRERLKIASAEERETLLSGIETSFVMGGKVLDKKWRNTDESDDQVSLFLKIENTAFVQKVGDMMLFGMPQQQRGTIFSSPNRKYPIVFQTPTYAESNVSYTIPNGYEILSLPKRISLETAFAAYTREYVPAGTKITGKEANAFKRSKVPITEYQKVREFFDELPRASNDKIVIQKKKDS